MQTGGDRWKELTAFVAEWSRPLVSVDGYTEAEIAAAEARLGFCLPESLRELYRLIGKREDLTVRQNELYAPEKLELAEGILVVWEENQGVWYLGIAEDNLGEADPPVKMIREGKPVSGQGEAWTLSQYALIMVATEIINAGDNMAIGFEMPPSQIMARSEPAPYKVLAENEFRYLDGLLAAEFSEIYLAAKTADDLTAALKRYEAIEWGFVALNGEEVNYKEL